jgi:hypothetical protein
MTKVVLDDEGTVAKLNALEQQVEICDLQGQVLGYYVPRIADRPRYFKGAKSPLTNEERERILREELNDAIPLSEFWERMRKKYPEKFQ